jgi:hypothetical protein
LGSNASLWIENFINVDNVFQEQYNQFNINVTNSGFNENISALPMTSSSAAELCQILNVQVDLIYIDGGHDYDCVVSDIKLMYEVSKNGSYVVFDDSSCYKNLSNDKFKGHIDVCNAIKDNLENNDQFVELICVGHNRVFKRIK